MDEARIERQVALLKGLGHREERIRSLLEDASTFEPPRCSKCQVEVGETDHACCRCRDDGRYKPGPGMLSVICGCQVDPMGRVNDRAGIPKILRGVTMAGIAAEPRALLQEWLDEWPTMTGYRHMVLLIGPAGVGKSGAAVAVCSALYARYGASPMFHTTTGFLGRLRASYDAESPINEASIIEAARNAQVLVLDDIGRENMTDWAADKLFGIIDHRYAGQLTTIVTANEPQFARLDGAWRSRLMCGLFIRFTPGKHKDRRLE